MSGDDVYIKTEFTNERHPYRTTQIIERAEYSTGDGAGAIELSYSDQFGDDVLISWTSDVNFVPWRMYIGHDRLRRVGGGGSSEKMSVAVSLDEALRASCRSSPYALLIRFSGPEPQNFLRHEDSDPDYAIWKARLDERNRAMSAGTPNEFVYLEYKEYDLREISSGNSTFIGQAFVKDYIVRDVRLPKFVLQGFLAKIKEGTFKRSKFYALCSDTLWEFRK